MQVAVQIGGRCRLAHTITNVMKPKSTPMPHATTAAQNNHVPTCRAVMRTSYGLDEDAALVSPRGPVWTSSLRLGVEGARPQVESQAAQLEIEAAPGQPERARGF